MDLFDEKNISPMLIGATSPPFDDPGYIFELKLDGERCVAYLDKSSTQLRNKRNMNMLPKVPELSELNKHIKGRCVLDGELAVIKDGRPDFYEIARRSILTNPAKIELASKRHPACFTAFDILYLDGQNLTDLPLSERKSILSSAVSRESPVFALSRTVPEHGTAFYSLVEERGLEGIVAKKSSSLYRPGKRTRDWIKIKYLQDEDFIICGYIEKENGVVSLVLGQYSNGSLTDKGHVTLGVRGEDFRAVRSVSPAASPPFPLSPGNANAIWIEPRLVCTVKFMMKSKSGGMRQPVFKGLRHDKKPEECVEES